MVGCIQLLNGFFIIQSIEDYPFMKYTISYSSQEHALPFASFSPLPPQISKQNLSHCYLKAFHCTDVSFEPNGVIDTRKHV